MGDVTDTRSVSGLARDLYNVHLDHVTEPEGPGAASGPPTDAGVTESDFFSCMRKHKEKSGSETSETSDQRVPTISLLSDSYDMNYPKRGHAIIFNNERFSYDLRRIGLNDRHGTKVDEQGMRSQLKKLGFEVKTRHNVSAAGMRAECEEMAALDHSDCDCFVCVILSHGEEGVVYGRDKAIELKELFRPFRGNSCPTLTGKPKIFFIQACRGNQTDPGVGVNVADAKGRDDTDAGRDMGEIKLPVDADFLLAYSTVPGYYSWRNGEHGSWFIKALCEILKTYGTEMDLMKMLTIVNQLVALKYKSSNPNNPDFDGMKQIPCITSMLTKDVFFSAKK